MSPLTPTNDPHVLDDAWTSLDLAGLEMIDTRREASPSSEKVRRARRRSRITVADVLEERVMPSGMTDLDESIRADLESQRIAAERIDARTWSEFFLPHGTTVTTLSSDNDRIITGSWGGEVNMFVAATGERACPPVRVGTEFITNLIALQSGLIAVSAGKTLTILNATGTVVRTEVFAQGIESLYERPNGTWTVSCGPGNASKGEWPLLITYDARGTEIGRKRVGDSTRNSTLQTTDDGHTVIYSVPSGVYVTPLDAKGKNFSISLRELGNRPTLLASSSDIRAQGGRFIFGARNDTGSFLILTDTKGNKLGENLWLGLDSTIRSIEHLGNGFFLVDVSFITPRYEETWIVRSDMGRLSRVACEMPENLRTPPLGTTATASGKEIFLPMSGKVTLVPLPPMAARAAALEEASEVIPRANLASGWLDTVEGRNLQAQEREMLLRLLSSLGGVYTDTWLTDRALKTRILTLYPEWQDASKAATMAKYKISDDLFVRSQDELVERIAARERDAFTKAIGLYIENAMDAVLTEARGGDPTPFLSAMRALVTHPQYTGCVHLLAHGIRLPSESQAIEGCRQALIQKLPTYRRTQADAAERLMQAKVRYESPTYAGSGAATPPLSPTITPARQAFLDALTKAQREIRMNGVAYVQTDTITNVTRLVSRDVAFDTPVGGVQESAVFGYSPDKISLGTIRDSLSTIAALSIAPNADGIVQFTLSEPSMVNLWIQGSDVAFGSDPTMTLTSRGTTPISYTSNRGGGDTGESVSTMLPAGTYVLTVKNDVSPSVQFLSTSSRTSIPVHVDIGKWNTANIEGRVSLEGSREVMPVSMRVAEFYEATGMRKKKYDVNSGVDAISKLDPTRPVWVVVHGMSDTESGMNLLAKALTEHPSSGGQVVTIDWSEAAASLITKDAPWTKCVGEWVANQLLCLGFAPSRIHFVGHSHGTYVSYAAARAIQHIGENINALVALDPAGNIPLLSGFSVGDMNFSNVAKHSIALEGSWMAGNDSLASTAHEAFKIDTGGDTRFYHVLKDHSMPVYVFTHLLLNDDGSGNVSLPLSLETIMTPARDETVKLKKNSMNGERYEGVIKVMTIEGAEDPFTKKKFVDAIPLLLQGILEGTTELKEWEIAHPYQSL